MSDAPILEIGGSDAMARWREYFAAMGLFYTEPALEYDCVVIDAEIEDRHQEARRGDHR